MKISSLIILRHLFLSLTLLFLIVFSVIYFVLGSEKNIFPEGAGYVSIVLDVSKSMNVEDVGNETRLIAAKNYIYNLIGNNPNYQFALTIFAGESQRVLPFTSDINLLATFLSGIDSRNITKQGTNISAAISDGITSFGEEKSGVLVLISDGDESKIEIERQLREEVQNMNLETYIIGVGSEEGGYVPSGDMMSPYEIYNGQRVIASVNTSGLKSLASNLRGEYSDVQDSIIKLSGNTAHTTQIHLQHNILIFFAIISWLVFLGTLIIQIYFPKFLRYE